MSQEKSTPKTSMVVAFIALIGTILTAAAVYFGGQLAATNREIEVTQTAQATLTPTNRESTPLPETSSTANLKPSITQSPNSALKTALWTRLSTKLPTEGGVKLLTIDSYLIVVGAFDPANKENVTREVFIAPIMKGDDSVDVGEWKSTTSLPRDIIDAEVISVDNTIYIFGGGLSHSPYQKVIYGTVAEDGEIPSWTETNPLPQGLMKPSAVVYKDNVYVIGGRRSNALYDSVYQAIIDSSNGSLSSFQSANKLSPIKGAFSAFMLDNNVYILSSAGDYVTSVRPDGALGEWKQLKDVSIQSELLVGRKLYQVIDAKLTSVAIESSSEFGRPVEINEVPRKNGTLLYADGVFYYISNELIYTLQLEQ